MSSNIFVPLILLLTLSGCARSTLNPNTPADDCAANIGDKAIADWAEEAATTHGVPFYTPDKGFIELYRDGQRVVYVGSRYVDAAKTKTLMHDETIIVMDCFGSVSRVRIGQRVIYRAPKSTH